MLINQVEKPQIFFSNNKTIAAISIPKAAEQRLRFNFTEIQKKYQEAKSVLLIMPTVSIEFRGENAQEIFVNAGNLLKKKRCPC